METHTGNTGNASDAAIAATAINCTRGVRSAERHGGVDAARSVTVHEAVPAGGPSRARFLSLCVVLSIALFVSSCLVPGASTLHAQRIPATRFTETDTDSLTLSVLESDNENLDPRSYFYPFSLRPSDSLAVWLRAALPADISANCNIEEEFFPLLVRWVHSRWQHDSFNSIAAQASSKEILTRAARGERFTCVEYAKVLTDLLVSHGYAARMVGLSRRNISNPKLGARHVVSEVWSCKYRKWIMLDGQFGSYVVKNSVPLNVTEIQDAARLADSTVTLITAESASNEGKGSSEKLSDSTEYATMLRNLDAFVDIPYVINDKVGMLMLVPKDRNEPLLFQGQVISNMQYTKNPEDLYASMGRVHMDLSINSKNKTPAQVLLQPEYEVNVSTSFPFTRYLEVSVDGAGWKRVNEPRFRWLLHPGENSVSTRTVCYSGCTTKPASLTVFYGLRKDAREARRRHSPRPESSPPERE